MRKEFVTRYEGNPILTKADVPYKVETVHNAGVVKFGDQYIMLFRSHLDTGRSIIGKAVSEPVWPLILPPDTSSTCSALTRAARSSRRECR